MELFSSPPIYENGVTIEDTASILKSDFGDGYSQSAENGLNSVRQTASVVWPFVTKAQKNTMLVFFRERKGVKNFKWTPPSEAESIWKCEKWGPAIPVAPGYYSMSATFNQVFDLTEDE